MCTIFLIYININLVVSVILEQKCNEAAATPTNSADNQVVKLPKRGSKSSLNRQSSQDSQNSGKYLPLIVILP